MQSAFILSKEEIKASISKAVLASAADPNNVVISEIILVSSVKADAPFNIEVEAVVKYNIKETVDSIQDDSKA